MALCINEAVYSSSSDITCSELVSTHDNKIQQQMHSSQFENIVKMSIANLVFQWTTDPEMVSDSYWYDGDKRVAETCLRPAINKSPGEIVCETACLN